MIKGMTQCRTEAVPFPYFLSNDGDLPNTTTAKSNAYSPNSR